MRSLWDECWYAACQSGAHPTERYDNVTREDVYPYRFVVECVVQKVVMTDTVSSPEFTGLWDVPKQPKRSHGM